MKRLLCLALPLAIGCSASWGAPAYTVHELPLGDRYTYSYAFAISNTGWVAADWGPAGGNTSASRCFLSGDCESVGTGHAFGISKDGVLVGAVVTDHNRVRGFKWDGVTLTYFEPFTDECPWCALDTSARAINKDGVIVGTAGGKDARGEVDYPVIFMPDGSVQKLPDWGGASSGPTGITNDGFIVGTGQHPDKTSRAWAYDGTTLIELGTLGGSWSYANAVNEHRQVVGCSALAGDSGRAGFIYQNGAMTPLPSPEPTHRGGNGCAKGINRHGQVVGSAHSSEIGDYVGTLFMKGKVFDLNSLLVTADQATWKIDDAADINDKGEIAATAVNRATRAFRAVVLIPASP